MLDDNGHVLRMLRAQPVGHLDAGMGGAEGDVEMVRARQAVFDRIGEHLANHTAQRVFNQPVVAQHRFRHTLSSLLASPRERARRVGGFCCPVPPEPRLLRS